VGFSRWMRTNPLSALVATIGCFLHRYLSLEPGPKRRVGFVGGIKRLLDSRVNALLYRPFGVVLMLASHELAQGLEFSIVFIKRADQSIATYATG
jgi:hypothetical protein